MTARVEPTIRAARMDDIAAIRDLIVISARELSRGYYDERQITAAIDHVFGVDTALIEDGTYYVIETGGELNGCGGWSRRQTLFGGDQYATRNLAFSDPTIAPAKIRAFFIHPRAVRQGLARRLLAICETEARAAGYKSVELMSTLLGIDFYEACGYQRRAPASFVVGDGVELGFVPMWKGL
jgi:GNAT superfamily N-acetyltransferase